jgi:heme exporter protein A
MGASVRVESLCKTIGARRVLRDVSFSVDEGETALLVGPNGSGKTTLLRVLATLSRPTSGRVWIGGAESRGDASRVIRQRIGYVAHAPLVYDDLTGAENLVFMARAAGLDRPQATQRAENVLDQVGLSDRASDRAGSYSRGLKQRLAIARALVTDPDVLLLDEPGSTLDKQATAMLASILDGLRGRTTVLLSTHDLAAHEGGAQRVLRLGDGVLEAA